MVLETVLSTYKPIQDNPIWTVIDYTEPHIDEIGHDYSFYDLGIDLVCRPNDAGEQLLSTIFLYVCGDTDPAGIDHHPFKWTITT